MGGTRQMLASIHKQVAELGIAASRTTSSLQGSVSAANAAGAAHRSLQGQLSSTRAAAATVGQQIASAAGQALASIDSLKSSTDGVFRHVATKFDDLLNMLQKAAAQGNTIAQQLLGALQQVQEGVTRSDEVIRAFGGTVVTLGDQTLSVGGLLQEFLVPNLTTAQDEIRKMVDSLSKSSDAIGALIQFLENQHNVYAKNFADLVKAFREGRITLDYLLRAAQDIKSKIPGSGTDQGIDALLKALQDAALQGRP